MAEDTQTQAPPRNKKRLLIVAVAVLVVLLAGVGVFVMLAGGGKEDKRAERAQEPVPAKTVLVPFEERLTVNLRSEDGRIRYLQVPVLHMEVADAATAKRLEELKPKISDRIGSLLRSKDIQTMMAPGSDIKLKEEMKQVVNETLGVSGEGQGVVEVILPQSFIVQ